MPFFALGMMHETLESYYTLNTKLIMRFNMSYDTLEEMLPFERDIYYALIIQELEKQKED